MNTDTVVVSVPLVGVPPSDTIYGEKSPSRWFFTIFVSETAMGRVD